MKRALDSSKTLHRFKVLHRPSFFRMGLLGFQLALLTGLGVGMSQFPVTHAIAVEFGQAEVDGGRFLVLAAPIGMTDTHKLLILEQLNDSRLCWQESGSNPTMVDPLLLQFDFTNICGRSVDSNGYSVRLAGEDLGKRYNLRIVEKSTDLILVAYSLVEKDVESFEIGRTHGYTKGFAKIYLDPGWRLTRRTFNGKSVGHLYFTNDRLLASFSKKSAPPNPADSTPTVRPTQPLPDSGFPQPTPQQPAPTAIPIPVPTPTPDPSPQPLFGQPTPAPTPAPITPVPIPVPVPEPTPAPTSPGTVPSVVVPTLPTTSPLPPNPPDPTPVPVKPQSRVPLPAPAVNYADATLRAVSSPTARSAVLPVTSGAEWSGFNLPEPAPGKLSSNYSLWATYYHTHRAENATTGYPLLNLTGNDVGVTLSQKDWCAAALEGSVQVAQGQRILGTYNYMGRGSEEQVDCSPYYPKLRTLSATNRVRFKRSNTLFGEGVSGYSLVPYRTIAVDDETIPIGSVLYIPEARGTRVTLPSGEQVVHDGYFYAADMGKAIQGNHIDMFLGVAERNPFPFVGSVSSATFHAYGVDDPAIKARLAAEHRSVRTMTSATP